MKQSAPALLLIPVCGLSFGVAAAADAPAAPDDTHGVALVTAHLLPKEASDTRLPCAGLGSLYWVARHPAQAWRALLPIQEGSVAYADVRVRCALLTNAPSGQAPCR
jgi:hypothetical protein